MKKLLSLFIFTATVATAAPIEFNQFDSPQQEADYQSLIQTLRCPQCQNNNIQTGQKQGRSGGIYG